IGEGTDVLEHLPGGVAVGDVGGREPARARRLENLDRPFRRDQGLVVRSRDHAGAVPLRHVDQLLRRDVHRLGERSRIAQRLRGYPVLTIRAVEVAAQHAEGQSIGSWKRVEEWLLLNWV